MRILKSGLKRNEKVRQKAKMRETANAQQEKVCGGVPPLLSLTEVSYPCRPRGGEEGPNKPHPRPIGYGFCPEVNPGDRHHSRETMGSPGNPLTREPENGSMAHL